MERDGSCIGIGIGIGLGLGLERLVFGQKSECCVREV